MHFRRANRGMSFMDVIIGTALMLVIFTALVGLLRSSIRVTAESKAGSIATTLAESQMEYIRSLSYDAVGTVGGIPAGTIPQNSTTTQNGLTFMTHTFVAYTDDPADGLGSNDSNHVTTDYKTVKVGVTYSISGQTRSVNLVSTYSPPGLETSTGGGTLKIAVVNATGAAVPGASVRIFNTSTSPSIDVTTFSDSDGIVYLGGAPTSTQYQIAVTKDGYSSAQTYTRDANNQNPTPGYLTVVKDQTTTGTFAIDVLSSLEVATYSPIATSTWSDTLVTDSQLADETNTGVIAGGISLAYSGGYAPSGSARSVPIAPTYLNRWSSANATLSVPAGTTAVFHITDSTGALVPDTVLPGNASGFTSTVDLTGISTTTYPLLGLSADLTTSSTSTTPVVQDWGLAYLRGPIPVPNIPYTLTGSKAIGTTGAGVPIIKTTVTTNTDVTGNSSNSLEWDSYAMAVPGYDVVDACNAPPIALSPGADVSSVLIVSTSTSNMALVSAHDDSGAALAGATITLTKGGTVLTRQTSACGAAYFGSLSGGSYDISVSKSGYTTFSATAVPVSGQTFYAATLDN